MSSKTLTLRLSKNLEIPGWPPQEPEVPWDFFEQATTFFESAVLTKVHHHISPVLPTYYPRALSYFFAPENKMKALKDKISSSDSEKRKLEL